MLDRFEIPPDPPVIDPFAAPTEDAEMDAIIEGILNPPDPEAEAKALLAAQLEALAGHIRSDFAQAYQHRQNSGVTGELLECARLRKGEYTPDQLAAIREYGGSEHYFNLVAQKCEAAEAWIDDQLGPETYEPQMEATPVPDLPAAETQAIDAELAQQAATGALMDIQTGAPIDVAALREQLLEDRRKAIEAEASARAEAETRKIQDQYLEGGFNNAYKDFIHYLTTYKTAFLVGLEVRPKKRARWTPTGLVIDSEPIPTWRAPNPLSVYPGANAATLQDGPLCETYPISAIDLKAMIGTEGWYEEQIRAALEGTAPVNVAAYLPEEITRAQNERRDPTINDGLAVGMLCGIWYHAEAREGSPFPVGAPIRAFLVGQHVVHAMVNPHPLGLRSYSCTSYKKRPGTVWGEALPEKGKAVQEAANACARNLIDNLAYGSGPSVAIDSYSVEAGQDVKHPKPRQVFRYDSSRLHGKNLRPIEWFQPDANAEVLTKCYSFFADMMDDVTLIPRYVQGNGDVRGAGQTASGMSMLMSAAGKGLRAILSNIQVDILTPQLEWLHLWNLKYLPDDQWGHIKGDARVKAIGPLQIMSRELSDQRMAEILDQAAKTPAILDIIGKGGLAKLAREVYERQKAPAGVVPSDEEIEARIAAEQAMAQQQAQMEAENSRIAALSGKGPGGKASTAPASALMQPTAPAPEIGLMEAADA
jgi:hypothetical protein